MPGFNMSNKSFILIINICVKYVFKINLYYMQAYFSGDSGAQRKSILMYAGERVA